MKSCAMYLQVYFQVFLFILPISYKGVCSESLSSTDLPIVADNIQKPDEESCFASDQVEVSRDLINCGVFHETCFKNRTTNSSTSTEIHLVDVPKSCESNLLFDVVEMKCLQAELVDCNLTEFICPGNDAYVADTKRPSWFIECHNDTGERSRHECQPHGTVFDPETHICVNPPFTEPFVIAAFRSFIRFLVHTKYTMSPWIEVVPVNSTSSLTQQGSNNSLKSDEDTLYEDEDEDQVEVFTSDTTYIVLYYSVLLGIPLIFIFFFLLMTCIIFKICWKPDESKELDFADEFYRYDPNTNDAYLTTRM